MDNDILTLDLRDTANREDMDAVHEGLRAYNARFADHNHKPLNIYLRDASGAIVGGLLGDTYFGWLSINILWIDDHYRGQRYGERLIGMAEDEARRRGCTHANLDTISFQAPAFYEKLGYRVYGVLEDFPVGNDHRRHYLTKDLEQART